MQRGAGYRLLGELVDHSLVELADVVQFPATLLEFDVGQPGLLIGEGLHPALEDGASGDDIADALLQIGEFVPG